MLIDEIYTLVKSYSNKNQSGGYLKPSIFSSYLNYAQQEAIDEVDRFAAHNRRVISLLSDIIKTTTVSVNSIGVVDLPSDYYRYLDSNALYFDDGKFEAFPVDYIGKSLLGERLRSKIVNPTLKYPVATEGFSGLMVEPKQINQIELTYLFKPAEAEWVGTGVPPVFNPNASTDVTLGAQFRNILVMKVCKYFGIEIRDGELVGATTKDLVQEFGITG